jgi:hypothetical protein
MASFRGGTMITLITEDDIARARTDPVFRQQLMAENLDRLLEALNRMRRTTDPKPTAKRAQSRAQSGLKFVCRCLRFPQNSL